MQCNFNLLKNELDKINKICPCDKGKFQIQIVDNQCFLSFIGIEKGFEFETICDIDNIESQTFSGVVDFHNFYEMVIKCKSDKLDITIDDDNDRIVLTCDNKVKRLGYYSDCFEPIIKTKYDEKFFSFITIPENKLKEIYDIGICCIEKTKEHLNGFYLDKNKDGSYNIATTDAMRLCIQSYNFAGKEIIDNNEYINRCFFKTKSFENFQYLKQDTTIYYNQYEFFINNGKTYYRESLKDNDFPKYRTVVPETASYSYIFNDCQQLEKEIIDCVMKKGYSPRIKLDFQENICNIEYSSKDITNNNIINCENLLKTNISFVINYKLLIDILKVINKQGYNIVKFELESNDKPITIECSNYNIKYIIMPYFN